MERTLNVGDIRALIVESSNEFKAKLGPGVESNDKRNNDKAYKDAQKKADEALKGISGKTGGEKVKYEKNDFNGTTLDYQPENVTDSYKKRVKAQALGYTSEAEMNNSLEKAGDFTGNKAIYDGIKASGREMHKQKEDNCKVGLVGRERPEGYFKKEEMYEGKKLNESYGESFSHITDILDTYANMVHDGHKLSDEQKVQVREMAKWLNDHNSIDDEVADEWIGLANSLLRESNNKMKTVHFKKTEFLSEAHMLSRIPDEFKVTGNVFRMKDKNDSEYVVEWDGSKGYVIEHVNKKGFNDSLEHMKSLMSYKSSDFVKNSTVSERLNENDEKFNETLTRMRNLIK